MHHLFSPLELRGVKLRNRIAMSPMCQYSSEDGFANDWHLVHLGSRAAGGAALIIAEASAILPEGRITPNCLGIWKDEHIPALQRITQFISQHNAVPGIQLAHAGVKASRRRPWDPKSPGYVPPEEGGWTPAGPTAKRFSLDGPIPREMNNQDIQTAINAYADAAQRAVRAGFQVIELHFAHGYLGHSFLTPLMNQRAGDYGGPFESRARFLIETAQRVRQTIPDQLPLLVRLSCADWAEGGWTIEDSVRIATMLRQIGVDLIDCSSGGATRDATIPTHPGYQVPFAEQIKREANIPTGAVGGITQPNHADEIIRNQQADLILIGRQLLREPHWPHQAKTQLANTQPPIIATQYAWPLPETKP